MFRRIQLLAEAYCEILKVTIRKFSLAKAHEGIESNLILPAVPVGGYPGPENRLG